MSYKLKDFTPAQAERWVLQEIVKHDTVESIDDRIRAERMMVDVGKSLGLPNSHLAHKGLLNRLIQKRLLVEKGAVK